MNVQGWEVGNWWVSVEAIEKETHMNERTFFFFHLFLVGFCGIFWFLFVSGFFNEVFEYRL